MVQSTSSILMVRPAAFGFDPLSAASNVFQEPAKYNPREQALAEFDNAVKMLRRANINVIVTNDTPEPAKPDAVFPNNWLTTWPDGRIFLYPMCVPTRRLERRSEIIDQLKRNFAVRDVIDLSTSETNDVFLESTGAMVFDHIQRVAYACIGPRCDAILFEEHAKNLGYEPIALHATDETGTAIYHTNVMMGIQTATAVVCGEALPAAERTAVFRKLENSGRQVVDISFAQMRRFAGNALELQSADGTRYLALSKNAFSALHPNQRGVLSTDKQLLPIPVPTIEMVGGGSIRCMIAELFVRFLPGTSKTV